MAEHKKEIKKIDGVKYYRYAGSKTWIEDKND